MRQARFVDMIYTHTEGEPTGIVHAGIPYPAGGSILDKRRFLEREYDWLRRAVMREPRGHRDMFGVFLTPPSQPGFDAGMIWIDGENFMHMCGHGGAGQRQALEYAAATDGGVKRRRHRASPGPSRRSPGRSAARHCVARPAGRIEWPRQSNSRKTTFAPSAWRRRRGAP